MILVTGADTRSDWLRGQALSGYQASAHIEVEDLELISKRKSPTDEQSRS